MTIRDPELADLPTPTGSMRTHVYRPQSEGRYPGLLLFSEIFQVTAPIQRTAAQFAGHGFVVAVPEIWHEFEAPGVVLPYDTAGADRGNALKLQKEVPAMDADSRAALDYLKAHPACTGRLGVAGICVGGNLSFRAAAAHPDILAAICYYATDLHKASLGRGGDDVLARTAQIKAEVLMIWGRQDPHVPQDGRRMVYEALAKSGVSFTWHEFNGQHAFIRDEGRRYDPELAGLCQTLSLHLLHRKLGEGDRPISISGAAEARH